jgi:magnesium-transporting ATPase (P-type)
VRTRAFTTLVLFQLFNAPNARSDERSAFHRLFRNSWLRGALVLSIALQIMVVYAPFLQPAFGTVSLNLRDWLVCVAETRERLRHFLSALVEWSQRFEDPTKASQRQAREGRA